MGYKQELIDYCNRIIGNPEQACKKHIWSCLRFLRDLKNEGTEEFPYVFDEEKAYNFVEWCCLFKHTKGVLTGKNIDLPPIGKFISGNIYGWYHKDTGYRRFQKIYWQVSRKNIKSQLLSLMSSYELLVFSGEEMAEVYSVATKKDQAKIVYDETVRMINKCEELEEDIHYKEAYGKLKNLSNGGFMRALSDEDRKKGDGLNPQFASVDEYHAHVNTEAYDVIDSGMGARTQPLLAVITTAGLNLNAPCYTIEYPMVSKILNPDTPETLESYFAMINELEINNTSDIIIEKGGRKIKPGEMIDDLNNPKCWIKANPVICSYQEGVDYLKKKVAEMNLAPEKRAQILTKHFNVWVNESASGYMNTMRWASCGFDGSIEEFLQLINKKTERNAYIGLDLAAKLDLTSVNFEFDADGIYYLYSHSFMPEEKYSTGKEKDKVPYDLWRDQGWLTVTPGPVADYDTVEAYIINMLKDNGWCSEEVCVDPWGATRITSNMTKLGHTVVEVVQGPKTLAEPTRNFKEEVYQGNIIHCNSPVLNWAVGNAIAVLDRNENPLLDKSKSTNRIDPLAAAINSHTRCMVRDDSEGVYTKRGMRTL